MQPSIEDEFLFFAFNGALNRRQHSTNHKIFLVFNFPLLLKYILYEKGENGSQQLDVLWLCQRSAGYRLRLFSIHSAMIKSHQKRTMTKLKAKKKKSTMKEVKKVDNFNENNKIVWNLLTVSRVEWENEAQKRWNFFLTQPIHDITQEENKDFMCFD